MLFGHTLQLVIKMLFLPIILTYLIVYDLQEISLMQNHLRKSSNNTLASLVCEINSNLDKTVHFIVKETHRLHNAVTELDIPKLTSCFFQCFITRPLVITMFRYLAILTSPMDLLIHTKHNLLMSNNIDQILFWKNIPITFSQGCS